jgi:hypothetical protein
MGPTGFSKLYVGELYADIGVANWRYDLGGKGYFRVEDTRILALGSFKFKSQKALSGVFNKASYINDLPISYHSIRRLIFKFVSRIQ